MRKNYLEDFAVLTGVGVDDFQFFQSALEIGVFEQETGVDSESTKYDSTISG